MILIFHVKDFLYNFKEKITIYGELHLTTFKHGQLYVRSSYTACDQVGRLTRAFRFNKASENALPSPLAPPVTMATAPGISILESAWRYCTKWSLVTGVRVRQYKSMK